MFPFECLDSSKTFAALRENAHLGAIALYSLLIASTTLRVCTTTTVERLVESFFSQVQEYCLYSRVPKSFTSMKSFRCRSQRLVVPVYTVDSRSQPLRVEATRTIFSVLGIPSTTTELPTEIPARSYLGYARGPIQKE
eukprot:3741370-Rhodomonas_salina.1